MLRKALAVLTISTVVAGPAWGGLRIDLRPDMPGPYNPGQTVNVDVFLVDTGNPQGNISFRGIFLDFADTEAGLEPATFFNWDDPFCLCKHSPLPNTSWVYPLAQPNPLFQITMPNDGEVHIGDINVMTNADGWLDVMDDDNADPQFGARVDFGFGGPGDPVTTWRAFTGEITGGALFMDVVPEPGTLLLLAAGVGVALRRRS